MVHEHLIKRANIVIEALPYIRKFHGKTMVIKYGGSAMVEEDLRHKVAEDVMLLKYVGMNPVVVHGGGAEVTKWLERLGIKTKFVEGLRVTDKKTMEVVEMVLGGKVNKAIVSLVNQVGGKAVGLSGKDGNFIKAQKCMLKKGGKKIDLGYTGKITHVNRKVIDALIDKGYVPIVSSLGVGEKGESYNINADHVASAIAGALNAEKLIILTDVAGVLDKKKKLISRLKSSQTKKMIKSGAISGGMIPKVSACLDALKDGVKTTHIVSGKLPHAILLEVFTDTGIGTMVSK